MSLKKINNMGIKPYNNLPSHLKNLKYSTPSKETKTIFIAADPLHCRGVCALKLSCKIWLYMMWGLVLRNATFVNL